MDVTSMMLEEETFADILGTLKNPASKRDPRSIRLAAVTSAITDVVGEHEVSAAKVYAATISALEGTLKLQTPQETLDSLSTQVALLELLRVTVPHVENPAILSASLPVSSRVLRGIISASLAVNLSDLRPFETKDELGGINAILRGVCRASVEILRRLTDTKTDEKILKQFFHGTLLACFDDHRPKVRKLSQNSISEIIFMENCNPVIAKSTSSFAHGRLCNVLKKNSQEAPPSDLLHLLSFLERCIGELDISTLGADLMKLLVALLKETTSNTQAEFVAMGKNDSTPKILAINSLLATVKELLDCGSERQKKPIDAFAPRALASLLQMQPSLVFREGGSDLDLLHRGRTLYGQVVISSVQRVMLSDPELSCKLLPVAVQIVLRLCGMGEEEVDESVTEPLMADLSALFRSQFQNLKDSKCSRDSLERCVANCLKSLEQVMMPAFQACWSVSLRSLVILLQEVDGHEMASDIVARLLKLRNEANGNGHSQRAVEAAIASLVEGMGVEEVWKLVDWTGTQRRRGQVSGSAVGVDLSLSWLLPVMKTASGSALGKRPQLNFFQKNVLGLARTCAMTVTKVSDRNLLDKWVVGIWNLFPCFCQHPVDLEEGFPNLIPTLVKAMEDKRYPQLLGIVCLGIETLSASVKERSDMNEEIITDKEVADENGREKEVLAEGAEKLLPVLFKNVERLHTSPDIKDEIDLKTEGSMPEPVSAGDCSISTHRTTKAIACLARHAPKPFLEKLFKKLMRRLLEQSQSQDEAKDKLCSLLNLSQALVASESLDESSVSLLYRTMRPMIKSDAHEAKVQKLAYKVLAEICRRHHAFVAEHETLKELIGLLTSTALTSQISARNMRLKCMGILVDGFDAGNFSNKDIVTKMTGEILLCLKDSKAKTRDTSYQVLVSLAKGVGNMDYFLGVIAAALGAETSHMRSAAVMASSRLVFEFAREDDNLQRILPSLLRTIIILFDEQSREVIKSAVGFVRVCVAAMAPDQLRPLLPDVVGSLLKYHKGKDRFRGKIKIILKKLVKIYGYDALMPFVPETETRLLTHMRKLDERAAKRKASGREDGAEGAQNYEDMVGSDEDDSDDGRTLMTGATGLTRKSTHTMSTKNNAVSQPGKTHASSIRSKATNAASLRLPSEADGEVINILGLNQRNVRFADDEESDGNDSDRVMEFDDYGRLVVNDEDNDMEEDIVEMSNAVAETVSIGSNKRRRVGESNGSTRNGENKEEGRKRKKNSKMRELGASYKSKKAGGDVKKKGQKFEPYAYVPLDGRSYSKKNRRHAVEQMATVVPQGGKRKRK